MVMAATDQRASREAARLRNTAPLRAWATRFDERNGGRGSTTFLSKRTGLTFAAVARVLKGKAQPSPYTAALFEEATGGEVTAAALLGIASTTVTTNGANARGEVRTC